MTILGLSRYLVERSVDTGARVVDLPKPSRPAADGAERRLRAIVEHQPSCLTEVAGEGRVLAMNAAHQALVGVGGMADVLGKDYQEFVAPADRERVAAFIQQVSGGVGGSLDYVIVEPGGRTKDVSTEAVPLDRESEGRVVALMVTRDLTDVRSLEERLQRLSEGHQRDCAELEALIQEGEMRERDMLAQRDEERRRVARALIRARTQLQEMKGAARLVP